MMSRFKYDAFISYRHVMPDEFVAQQVHRQLENFKLPKNITKKLLEKDPNARTKITRVFRDQEELPLASNLADPIVEALNDSEYLIVICSPRLKDSIWCQKEIDTFISLRGKEHILAVLAEGEPGESFPEVLLTRDVTVTDINGITSVIQEKVEPLAADARGNSEKERKKKLKTELLRLAAPMFGVSFDDLKQRHKEQRMRRILGISLASSLIFLIFGIISSMMALKISSQNDEITKQNKEIVKQSEEISKQSQKINEQYQEALINHGIAMAQTANMYYEKGDRMEAVKTAYEVFPKTQDSAVPYVADVENALNRALHSYDAGFNYSPERIIRASTNITSLVLSGDYERMLTCDLSGEVIVWDPLKGEKIWRKNLLSTPLYDSDELAFIGDGKIIINASSSVILYDYKSDKELLSLDSFGDSKIRLVPNSNKAILIDAEKFVLIDADSDKVIYSMYFDEGKNVNRIETSKIDSTGQYFGLVYETEGKKVLSLRNVSDGSVVWETPVSAKYIGFIRVFDDGVYLAANDALEGSILGTNSSSVVYSYDYNGNVRWKLDIDDNWVSGIVESNGEGNSMVAYGSDLAYVITKSGELKHIYTLGSSVVNAYASMSKGSGIVIFLTRNGEWVNISVDQEIAVISTFFTESNSDNLSEFLIANAQEPYLITHPYSSNEVTLYKNIKSPYGETIVEELPFGFMTEAVNEELSLYAGVHSNNVNQGAEIEVVDIKNKKLLGTVKSEDYVKGLFFDDNMLICMAENSVNILDANTLNTIKTINGESFRELLAYDTDAKRFYFTSYEGLGYCDYEAGKISKCINVKRPILSQDGTIMISPNVEKDQYEIRKIDTDMFGKVKNISDIEISGVINENYTFIEKIIFDNSGEYLFISYYDNSFDVIRISNEGKLDKDSKVHFDGVGENIIRATYDSNLGYGALYTIYGGNIFKADNGELNKLEIIGDVKGLIASDKLDKLIISDRNTLIETHILSKDELVKLAKETLGE